MLLASTSPPGQATRRRGRLYRLVTRLLSVALLPLAFVVTPHRARHVACQWALAARFPAENLDGLTPATRAAVEAARTETLLRHGEVIGLTDGYRDAHAQARLFAGTVRRTGSPGLAMMWALPPHESRHVDSPVDARTDRRLRRHDDHRQPAGRRHRGGVLGTSRAAGPTVKISGRISCRPCRCA